jgi:hypothetical protein
VELTGKTILALNDEWKTAVQKQLATQTEKVGDLKD